MAELGTILPTTAADDHSHDEEGRHVNVASESASVITSSGSKNIVGIALPPAASAEKTESLVIPSETVLKKMKLNELKQVCQRAHLKPMRTKNEILQQLMSLLP
jgi:hypothetical protein